jgi:hypothetical protein
MLDRLGCLSFRSALASICRIRSRVTENCWPTCSSVWSLLMPMPKRMRTMRSSRGVSEARTRDVMSRRFDWIAASIGRIARCRIRFWQRVFVMSQESRRRAWEKKQQRLEAERQKRKELARAAQLSAVSSSTDSDSNQVTPEVSAKNDVMSANQNSSAKPKQSLLDRWRRLSRWRKI